MQAKQQEKNDEATSDLSSQFQEGTSSSPITETSSQQFCIDCEQGSSSSAAAEEQERGGGGSFILKLANFLLSRR
jgi:hypothetical protein